MKIDINYGNIGRTLSIEESIKTELARVDAMTKDTNVHYRVWLKEENPIQSAGLPSFVCTINMHLREEQFIVHKKSFDLYKGLSKARAALQKRLRRYHRKPDRFNARESKRNFMDSLFAS